MIEYILLFGLGFLSSGLVALLMAPSIHRSIVRFTENRLRATMPFSPQEVRAQKDLVRAALAAENARTAFDLARERDKIAGLMVENDTLSRNIVGAFKARDEMVSSVIAMREEVNGFRTTIAEDNAQIDTLKNVILRHDEAIAEKNQEIEKLVRRRDGLLSELDNLKIELAARQTQIENLSSRVTNLRDERDSIRKEGKAAVDRAKDLELRLVREENKSLRLQERLDREVSTLADKSTSLERRSNEIIRLKERLKETTWEAREAARVLKTAGLAVPELASKTRTNVTLVTNTDLEDQEETQESLVPSDNSADKPAIAFDAQRFSDEVRSKNNALTQLLLKGSDALNDDALREEIASIAAEMIVLTAANDGPNSPIRTILGGNAAQSRQARQSLAERSLNAIRSEIGS